MIDPQDMAFTVGRASLVNGPVNAPFPARLTQTGGRLRIGGVYHPEAVSNESIELRHARALGFIQQWTGLAGEVDAVPVVVDRQPQLTGFYRVRSTAIDWIKSLTVDGGTVEYQAELELIQPGASAAVCEVQYATGVRPTTVHAVTPEGLIWVPRRILHQNRLLLQFTRDGVGGDVAGDRVPPAGATAVAGSFQFGIRPKDFYAGSCRVEMRHHRVQGGAVGPWVDVVGKQIAGVEARDVRISNGVTRCTWLGQDAIESSADDGQIIIEAAKSVSGADLWFEVARIQLSSSVAWRPVGTPVVVLNTPESVTLKVACNTGSNSPSQFVSYSLDRGQRFVRFAGFVGEVRMVEIGTVVADRTGIVGGIESDTVTAEGFGWVFAHDAAIVNDVGTGERWSIGSNVTPAQHEWAVGIWVDDVQERAADVIKQWWLATAQTQRFVAL